MKIMYTLPDWANAPLTVVMCPRPDVMAETHSHPILVQDAEGFPEGWEVGSRVRARGFNNHETVTAIFFRRGRWCFLGDRDTELWLCSSYDLLPPEKTVTLQFTGPEAEVERVVGYAMDYDITSYIGEGEGSVRIERVEHES